MNSQKKISTCKTTYMMMPIMFKEKIWIIQSMQSKQDNDRFYNPDFENFDVRLYIIKTFFLKKCLQLEISECTYAISIALFDAVISKLNLDNSLILKIGQISLLLACKINEPKNVSVKDLQIENNPTQIQLNEVPKFEKFVLKVMKYKINMVTPFHFLLLLTGLQGVQLKPSTNRQINPIPSIDFFSLSTSIYILTSFNYQVNQFNSLSVALAIIMLTRKLCDAEILMPPILQSITGLSPNSLDPVLTYLTALFYNNFTN